MKLLLQSTFICLFSLLLITGKSIESIGQTFSARLKANCSLLEGPAANYDALLKLKAGQQIFLLEKVDLNKEFLLAYDTKTGTEGYIKTLNIGKSAPYKASNLSVVEIKGASTSEAELEITNKTGKPLIIRLEGSNLKLGKWETVNLTVNQGRVHYLALQANMPPQSGEAIVYAGIMYQWAFTTPARQTTKTLAEK